MMAGVYTKQLRSRSKSVSDSRLIHKSLQRINLTDHSVIYSMSIICCIIWNMISYTNCVCSPFVIGLVNPLK